MTVGSLALFEDEHAGGFEPLALTRSVAALRLGAWTHRERWERIFPDRNLVLLCRGAVGLVEEASGDWQSVGKVPSSDVMFVAAALGRVSKDVLQEITALEPGHALIAGGRLVAARAAGDAAVTLAAQLRSACGQDFLPSSRSGAETPSLPSSFRVREIECPWPGSLVDLIAANASALEEDVASYFSLLRAPEPGAQPGVHLLRRERIRLGDSVRVDPGVVLDASDGPILIGPRTRVMAGAVVTGPVAVGPDCRLRPLARVEATSLGPGCRIGGEVSGSIVLAWSNKQHDGFLGHSYVGAWVNLGAATDTSDLKNDYGSVRISVAGNTIDTGERHVGSLIGDHTKTAIHTRLNTGTVLGVGCNVLGGMFPPKAVPSFCWGGDGTWAEYRLEKAIDVASLVLSRRDQILGTAASSLLRALHGATAASRAEFLRPL